MRKKILKKKIIALFVVMFLFFITTFNYAATWMVAGGMDGFFENGPGDAELVVAGDSYAQRFYLDEKDRGMKFYPYFQEGHSIEENKDLLQEAFYSVHQYILFSISVNDRHRNTHPAYFEDEYRRMVALAILTNKTVFVHSYMYYGLAGTFRYEFTPYEYDNMIRKIAADYENIYYIDMSDCIGEKYMHEDGIHYNKKFNDLLYDRIDAKIKEIKANNEN